jgi:hypothetical protein
MNRTSAYQDKDGEVDSRICNVEKVQGLRQGSAGPFHPPDIKKYQAYRETNI